MLARMGILGAHRSGKTTLAKQLAEHFEVPFVETKCSDSFKKFGLSPRDSLSFKDRMRVQFDMLDSCLEVWSKQTGAFISDRTPIDLLSYMIAEINQGVAASVYPNVLEPAAGKYLGLCAEASKGLFDGVLMTSPLYEPEQDETKAFSSEVYGLHLCILMSNFAEMWFPRTKVDDPLRFDAIQEYQQSREERFEVGKNFYEHLESLHQEKPRIVTLSEPSKIIV